MIGKLLRALVVPAMAIALATVPVPDSAHAAQSPHFQFKDSNQGRIRCQLPYLSTGLGPIAQCSRDQSFNYVVFGFYSPITNDFSTIFVPYKVSMYWSVEVSCLTEEGYTALCLGYPFVPAGTSMVTRATQYQSGAGRWGFYSFDKGFFADGGWYPLVDLDE